MKMKHRKKITLTWIILFV